MKLISNILILCIAAFAVSCNQQKEPQNIALAEGLIFGQGTVIINDNFTGTVWLNSLIEADSINENSVGNVTFEPGARTSWHLHPAGQILLATAGVGYYQEKGGSKRILRKGDVIKCPANVPHWHGASTEKEFVQIAVTSRKGGPTKWLVPVTEEEYTK